MIDLASLLIILAVTLVIYCVKYIKGKCQRDPRMVKLAETLPGPPRLPLVGNSMDFYFKRGMGIATLTEIINLWVFNVIYLIIFLHN